MVQDKYLMGNKENGNYRPSFLAIQDYKNKELELYIMIAKYGKKIYNMTLVKDISKMKNRAI